MLTDSFLESQGGLIPVVDLCHALGQMCIPLAGRRITELRASEAAVENEDEVMIEIELCIGLIFKPMRHHIKSIVNEGGEVLMTLWVPILNVLKRVLDEPVHEYGSPENKPTESATVVKSSKERTVEYMRNVITVLIDYKVLKAEPMNNDDISARTWSAVSKMDYCKKYVDEWKEAASQ